MSASMPTYYAAVHLALRNANYNPDFWSWNLVHHRLG